MWNYNISAFHRRLSVCQSVSLTCGLMYWPVLYVFQSVFQSVSPFVGERSVTQGHLPLSTGFWSLVILDWSYWQPAFSWYTIGWKKKKKKILMPKLVLTISLRWKNFWNSMLTLLEHKKLLKTLSWDMKDFSLIINIWIRVCKLLIVNDNICDESEMKLLNTLLPLFLCAQ